MKIKLQFYEKLYLVIVTIFNQSQNGNISIKNSFIFLERLLIKAKVNQLAQISYSDIVECMIFPTVLHRFPNRVSEYLFKSIKLFIRFEEDGGVDIFSSQKEIEEYFLQFYGIGKHKAFFASIVVMIFLFSDKNIEMTSHELICSTFLETLPKELKILKEIQKKCENIYIED